MLDSNDEDLAAAWPYLAPQVGLIVNLLRENPELDLALRGAVAAAEESRQLRTAEAYRRGEGRVREVPPPVDQEVNTDLSGEAPRPPPSREIGTQAVRRSVQFDPEVTVIPDHSDEHMDWAETHSESDNESPGGSSPPPAQTPRTSHAPGAYSTSTSRSRYASDSPPPSRSGTPPREAQAPYEPQPSTSRAYDPPAPPRDSFSCWNCGDRKHKLGECPLPKKLVCKRCGRPGYTVKQCPQCGPGYHPNQVLPPRPPRHASSRRAPHPYDLPDEAFEFKRRS